MKLSAYVKFPSESGLMQLSGKSLIHAAICADSCIRIFVAWLSRTHGFTSTIASMLLSETRRRSPSTLASNPCPLFLFPIWKAFLSKDQSESLTKNHLTAFRKSTNATFTFCSSLAGGCWPFVSLLIGDAESGMSVLADFGVASSEYLPEREKGFLSF